MITSAGLPGSTPEAPIDNSREAEATDIAAYLKSDGAVPAMPALLITTQGRTTGLWHRTIIFHAKDGDDVLVYGSNRAGEKDPEWYLNLEVNPTVYVQVSTRFVKTTAWILDGTERERALAKLIEAFPPYLAHQQKVAREIGVVLLHPVSE
jgi:deazaflavin-dependent oxidoreductase (nitroreductase family)